MPQGSDFLIKIKDFNQEIVLKAFSSAAGLRPAATAAKNEVNTFLAAAQAACRETAE